jgi:flagellar biosynthesis GTPase FlhF
MLGTKWSLQKQPRWTGGEIVADAETGSVSSGTGSKKTVAAEKAEKSKLKDVEKAAAAERKAADLKAKREAAAAEKERKKEEKEAEKKRKAEEKERKAEEKEKEKEKAKTPAEKKERKPRAKKEKSTAAPAPPQAVGGAGAPSSVETVPISELKADTSAEVEDAEELICPFGGASYSLRKSKDGNIYAYLIDWMNAEVDMSDAEYKGKAEMSGTVLVAIDTNVSEPEDLAFPTAI